MVVLLAVVGSYDAVAQVIPLVLLDYLPLLTILLTSDFLSRI